MTAAHFPDQLARLQSIAQALRDLRGEEKQEYVAGRIGYSRRHWIRWEQGQAIPSYKAILRIRKVYPAFQVTL